MIFFWGVLILLPFIVIYFVAVKLAGQTKNPPFSILDNTVKDHKYYGSNSRNSQEREDRRGN